MKTLIVLALAVTATLAVSNSELRSQWAEFKAKQNKQYNNPLEEVRRMSIFADNVRKIEEHNVKYEKGEVTYFKAVNQFSDWTKEEFLDYVNRGKATRPKIDQKLRLPWTPSKKPVDVDVDWRGNAVTEVKNQGSCGSCWSFSTTGGVEGQLALLRGQLISLSEQQLMDCSSGYGNGGCEGGWMDSAFSYIHDNGIESEGDYPYEARDADCRYDPSRSVTSIAGYYDLPSGDEGALANACQNNGPISIAIDASDELQSYGGGILYDNSCNDRDLNHGVLIVGLGNENGNDFWIIKNSWGGGWGEGGFYRAARNAGNNCGVATAASFPAL